MGRSLGLLSVLTTAACSPAVLADSVINGPPPENVSPNGQYAIGWTLVRVDPEAKPVDWTAYDASKAYDFLDHYAWDPDAATHPYRLFDCVIAVASRKTVELPSSFPWWPGRNHSEDLVVDWTADSRFALIQNPGRFDTRNLWLVDVAGGNIRWLDLTSRLDRAVGVVVEDKRPFDYAEYAFNYPLSNSDSPSVTFGPTSATFPFSADIPKSDDPASAVEGTVVVRLSDGTVENVSSNTPRDNPFVDDPALAAADHELNQVYTRLKSKLTVAQLAALKEEQITWITERNLTAKDAQGQSADPSGKPYATKAFSLPRRSASRN